MSACSWTPLFEQLKLEIFYMLLISQIFEVLEVVPLTIH